MSRTPEPRAADGLSPPLRSAAIEFIRRWLPEPARRTYRAMMRRDPTGWMRDPHFASGFFTRVVLRGNGLDERALGMPDLEPIWPELLAEAVLDDEGLGPEHRAAG
jgi:hypothetical protein